MIKINKALFLFGMLLLAAFASAQEAVNNVEAEASANVLPNARRLNTNYKGGYPAYGYGYPAYGYNYGYPAYGRGYGFPGFGIGAGVGFPGFGIGAGIGFFG